MAKKTKLTTKITSGVNKVIRLTDKINPLQGKTDKSTITDTGAESLKQVNSGVRTVRSGIRTVKSNIKTTKKTIKAVKNAPKNIKRTIKITTKVVKATVKVIEVTVKVISKVIAFLVSNPIVILIVLVIALVIYLITSFVVLLTGAAAGEATTKHSFSEAGGLDDVAEQLEKGIGSVKKCREDIKKSYDQWIDKMYYEDNNDKRRYSDLIYLKRFDKDNNETEYQKRLASNDEKQILKDALDWNKGVDDIDILSIAYVLSEKEKHNTDSSEYQINLTEYSDELIKKVTDKIVLYYDSHIYDNQRCPGENCYLKEEKNPEWDRADRSQEKLHNGYIEWVDNIIPFLEENSRLPGSAQSSHWEYNVQHRLDRWASDYSNDSDYGSYYIDTSNNGWNMADKLYAAYSDWWDYRNDLPEYTYTPVCENAHRYYSKGLEFFSKNEVLELLGFNETEKVWEQYTEVYFRSLYLTS